MIPTRASLIGRLKDWRDQASWQRFFDTYWGLIYGAARRTGLSDAEAQDVVQETIITVWEEMPGFQYDPRRGEFKAWLLGVTRCRIIDQVRKRLRGFPLQSNDISDEDTDSPSPRGIIDPSSNALDELWEAEWQNTLIAGAMAIVKRNIDPKHFQIFDFHVNKHWPAEKVASTFKVKVGYVYVIRGRVAEMIASTVARLNCGTI